MGAEMAAIDWSAPWFLHAAFFLTAAAFLLRDILWLRALTICANIFLIYGAYSSLNGPMWPNIYYYLGLVSINALHGAYLLYERTLTRLSGLEQIAYDSVFRALDRVSVKKLLRAGEWLVLLPGEMLVHAGQPAERVYAVVDGTVTVKLMDKIVTSLAAGNFVGEISYLTDGPATADVVAEEPVRCVAWERELLHRLLDRNKDLHAVMYAAFGADLAAKLAAGTHTLAEA